MERKILGIKITDKIPNEEISVKTNILNIIKHITNTKWRWAGHVARMQDNRWTIRTTEWQVRKGRRPRGRPKMRWKDDIMKWQGAAGSNMDEYCKRQKEVERTYGGLLPAVEGHSLGTRYKVQGTRYIYTLYEGFNGRTTDGTLFEKRITSLSYSLVTFEYSWSLCPC